MGTWTVISSPIVADGVFIGAGTIVELPNLPGESDDVSRDDLVFAYHNVHLVSTNKSFRVTVDPKTCAVTGDTSPASTARSASPPATRRDARTERMVLGVSEPVLHIAVDVTFAEEQIRGHVCDGVRRSTPFSGWLGLIGALDGILTPLQRPGGAPTARTRDAGTSLEEGSEP
jgi:hypothetical protein